MGRLTRQLLEKAEQAQRELTPKQQEDRVWASYNSLWGALQVVCSDLYARASLSEHLDNLLGTSLLSVPDYQKERAETADAKITSANKPAGASAAPSGMPSGSSTGKSSRDPSFSESDLDDGQR